MQEMRNILNESHEFSSQTSKLNVTVTPVLDRHSSLDSQYRPICLLTVKDLVEQSSRSDCRSSLADELVGLVLSMSLQYV